MGIACRSIKEEIKGNRINRYEKESVGACLCFGLIYGKSGPEPRL